jgi:hypothetical protein
MTNRIAGLAFLLAALIPAVPSSVSARGSAEPGPEVGIPGLSPYGDKSSTNPMIIRGQMDLSVILARQALEQVRTGRLIDNSDNIAATLIESYIQLRFARSGLLLKRTQYNPLPELTYNALLPAAGHIDNAWRKASSVSKLKLTEAELAQMRDTIIEHLESAIPLIQQYEDLI